MKTKSRKRKATIKTPEECGLTPISWVIIKIPEIGSLMLSQVEYDDIDTQLKAADVEWHFWIEEVADEFRKNGPHESQRWLFPAETKIRKRSFSIKRTLKNLSNEE